MIHTFDFKATLSRNSMNYITLFLNYVTILNRILLNFAWKYEEKSWTIQNPVCSSLSGGCNEKGSFAVI